VSKLKGEQSALLSSCLQKVGFFNESDRKSAFSEKLDEKSNINCAKSCTKLVVFDKDGTLVQFNEAYGPWIEHRVKLVTKSLKLKQHHIEKLYNFLGYDISRRKVCGESSFVA